MDADSVTPQLERLIDLAQPLEKIAYGMEFGEGPVWDRRTRELYWVDIIGDTIWKWKPGAGKEVVLRPSGWANGLTFDREGRLLVAGWSSRTVWRFEKDGRITVIADRHEGKKFNSPNDIVVRSDGTIYWTDSAGGLVNLGMVGPDIQRQSDIQGVYCLSTDGRLSVVTAAIGYPNGIAFSPDEKLLYVNDTRVNMIYVHEMLADGNAGPARDFHKLQGSEPGAADGMKVDQQGNIYCTGPGGIHIIDAQSRLLGRLRFPAHVSNLCWGEDDWKSLFITDHHFVYRARVKVAGIAVW